MAWIIWLAAAIILGIAEMASLTFVLLMLAGGAAGAALAAALGAPLPIQGLVFVVVSTLALVGVRPYARRLRDNRAGPGVEFGARALEGATAVVLERVDRHHGLIKIEGQEWSARSYDGDQILEPGEDVNIVEIRGATAMVWRQS
ncbi:MAG TPA: NfeD family protein [Stackebrandtia sp.]|uniref:NfeD family protein n=1 Tax=Stackebrandtia sp. TaxID=2023065 RepID=UPI002D4FE744|nr:NfeD family protein [Stackebrandtia sp.]HZE37483.1 NfeD family protein [Stackebrandtia sp.]